MAVIIREKKIIEGKEYIIEVYKTKPGRLLTNEEKKKAEKLDLLLEKKIKDIEEEMKNKGLMALKGKKGEAHRLWYEVGKRLDFIMDTSIVAAEDREYIWRAIYDHVRELHKGPVPERARITPERSHFSYCYKLSRFSWEFVDSAGDWASWSEFFDRKETKNDSRIIEWLGKKAKEGNVSGMRNWLRPLTKAIHKEFMNKDTTAFNNEELDNRLNVIVAELKKNEDK